LGITFKENVPDIRNSRVPDIHAELREFGCSVISHDPIACPEEVHAEYGITLSNHSQLKDLDAVILAVSHDHYLTDASSYRLSSMLKPGGVVIDVKSALSPSDLPEGSTYWAL
jgi:UDP-N-acetyl-D-galactosamine dehydrogenase